MSRVSTKNIPTEATEVVDFWRDAGPRRWFAKDTPFDEEFTRRFMALHFAVAAREREDWLNSPYANLALVLLMDQFPRNAFRGTAHMYATDPLGRHYARALINSDFIDEIEDELKLFVCVPFIHSENIDDQAYALELYPKYAADGIKWAHDHHEIIQRFGRFPHRNPELGRLTTPQEQHFLEHGGFAG